MVPDLLQWSALSCYLNLHGVKTISVCCLYLTMEMIKLAPGGSAVHASRLGARWLLQLSPRVLKTCKNYLNYL